MVNEGHNFYYIQKLGTLMDNLRADTFSHYLIKVMGFIPSIKEELFGKFYPVQVSW